jgi:hypothetical protein
MKAWPAEEVRAFLKFVTEDRLYPLICSPQPLVCAVANCWAFGGPTLSLDTGRLSVRQTLISVAYQMQFSECKTNRSRRTFSLDPATINALKAWRSHQLEERLALGPAREDTGLVFTREGTYGRSTRSRRHWHRQHPAGPRKLEEPHPTVLIEPRPQYRKATHADSLRGLAQKVLDIPLSNCQAVDQEAEVGAPRLDRAGSIGRLGQATAPDEPICELPPKE